MEKKRLLEFKNQNEHDAMVDILPWTHDEIELMNDILKRKTMVDLLIFRHLSDAEIKHNKVKIQ